jgi:GTP-binding protein
MFVDRVILQCAAGKGGDGVIAWRREKYIPKGGPSGGNGGKGGSITLQADENVPSLEWFANRRIIKAQNGAQGAGGCKQGKNGQDLILKVPCGTLVRDAKTNKVLFDLTKNQETELLCRGGKGGKGNFSFRSSTNRAPNIATPGQEGESCEVELELKLIADVGLVGFPNAGKSTLISTLAKREVHIASYPFTTLQPNIGIIRAGEDIQIFIADIPGIIEGAHRNRGLGLEFLRHIERTRILLFVLDASGFEGRSPADDFTVLRRELELYDPKLLERPFFVVLNKCDMEGSSECCELFLQQFPNLSWCSFCISAAQGIGCQELQERLVKEFTKKEAPLCDT